MNIVIDKVTSNLFLLEAFGPWWRLHGDGYNYLIHDDELHEYFEDLGEL